MAVVDPGARPEWRPLAVVAWRVSCAISPGSIGVRKVIEDLDIKDIPKPILLKVDNTAVIDRVKTGRHTSATKFHARDFHKLREAYLDGDVAIEHIPGEYNPADLLTKPLPPKAFLRHRRFLGMEFLRVLNEETTAEDIDPPSSIDSQQYEQAQDAIVHGRETRKMKKERLSSLKTQGSSKRIRH